ncbi:hypothetical protein SLEP1_g20817 [Rubroshorea leprosula]|uniref:DUF7910 domain-containing protein n=1 Tax=Rubroshorea leprosula TaxID=152421 RepID=A0AAV5J3X1_9ROSI|nr:hypothetical protein SLEP1_g20817 [Rubroshorea leprosula]
MSIIFISTRQFLSICLLSFVLSFSNGMALTPRSPIKAVNLGGWLVTEGWIKPSLFDGIPNKDFLDGIGLQFKSVTTGRYLCVEDGGGTIIVANKTVASGWEAFSITCPTFHFIASCLNLPICVTFMIVFVVLFWAQSEALVTADCQGSNEWGDNDPSVFLMTCTGRLQGEFQVTNRYGPENAPKVMREHWKTFIVEDDFKFISKNGLNAVRIPVGWWIASDPSPPWPFVGGFLEALDNAFSWAEARFLFQLPSKEMAINNNLGSVSHPTIPLFKGNGYEIWSTKMKTLFMSQDLWDLVERGYTEAALSAEALKDTKKKDVKALFFI